MEREHQVPKKLNAKYKADVIRVEMTKDVVKTLTKETKGHTVSPTTPGRDEIQHMISRERFGRNVNNSETNRGKKRHETKAMSFYHIRTDSFLCKGLNARQRQGLTLGARSERLRSRSEEHRSHQQAQHQQQNHR
jgi:hypothetical protein